MSEPAAVSQRESGWIGPIAALLLLFAVPFVPPLRVLVPVEYVLVLLLPMLAVCTLLGWWAGGRVLLMLAWIGLAAWMLSAPHPVATPNFDRLQRGWAVLLAASFGMVYLVAPALAFLTRALAAVGMSFVTAIIIAIAAGGSWQELSDAVATELNSRNQQSIAAYQQQVTETQWMRDLADGNPAFAAMLKEAPARLEALAVHSVNAFPALLALEALAVIALAWALFHRLSRTRIGDPLPQLRDFRFNDQLVWGLLLGITLLLIPSMTGLEQIGWTLVFFFAGLYVVRGMAVAAWMLRSHRRLMLAAAILLTLALPAYMLAALLGLGVGDTWADWRQRPQPTT